MPRDYGRRMPFDPAMVREILRSPRMRAEQGEAWLQEWGGPGAYEYWARQSVPERMVYFAVQAGYTTQPEIVVVTGLSEPEVSGAITSLESKGFISIA